MSRILAICTLILAATVAAAQAAQPPTETDMAQALGQTLTEALSAQVQWRARALADEREIATLEAELKSLRDSASAPKKSTAPIGPR